MNTTGSRGLISLHITGPPGETPVVFFNNFPPFRIIYDKNPAVFTLNGLPVFVPAAYGEARHD
jgi:hypothetical protein